MVSPLAPLSMITRRSRQVLRDLHTIAQAAPALVDIAWALGPVPEVIARMQAIAAVDDLADRLPEFLDAASRLPDIADAVQPLPGVVQQIRELPAIDQAVQSLPMIVDGVRNLPVVEEAVLALIATLEPALDDLHRVREVVEVQQQQVTHVEEMVQTIQRRSVVLERAVVGLKAQADEAMRALPDPDEDRGAIAKVREALTGST